MRRSREAEGCPAGADPPPPPGLFQDGRWAPDAPASSRGPRPPLQPVFSDFWAFALGFLPRGVSAHICQQNPARASRLLSCLFSRREEGLPLFSGALGFVSAQHCLVVTFVLPPACPPVRFREAEPVNARSPEAISSYLQVR